MRVEIIAKLLQELGGRASIRPDEGAFRTRVMDEMAEQLDDVCEDIEEINFDLEVEIEWDCDPRKISLSVRAASADFDMTILLHAYQLKSRERSAILKELVTAKRRLEVTCEVSKPKVIVRKRAYNSYDLHIAAQKLDVSSEWLKKMLPCTSYKCSERDDGKKDLELRYSKDMVDRLCKIRENTFDAEDLQYIADLCCEGDMEWALDIVTSMNSRVMSHPEP